MKTFEEFIREQVVWNNTEHFEILIEAVSQIKEYPSVYLKNYELDKRRISELYKKIFDLSNKNPNIGVNHHLNKKYYKDVLKEKDYTKICKKCQKELSVSKFYSNGYAVSGAKKYKSNCIICENRLTKERFNKKLEQIYGKLECKICNYSKCIEALEFHHINPINKDINISNMRTASLEILRKELNKGIFLCANCHRETHYGLHPKYLINE